MKNQVVLTLSEQDVRGILLAIRHRQDDCRLITSDCRTYPIYNKLDLELEGLKMRVANQLV